jgi:hypothetical protein
VVPGSFDDWPRRSASCCAGAAPFRVDCQHEALEEETGMPLAVRSGVRWHAATMRIAPGADHVDGG